MISLFFAVLCIAFLTYGVNVNKINLIYIPFVYFISSFLELIYNNKYRFLLSIILVIYCYCYVNFIDYYFNDFKPSILFVDGNYFEALEYVESIYGDGYSSICVSTNVTQDYIFNLLTSEVNPYYFNENLIIRDKGNGNYVASYKHYIYDCNELKDDFVYLVSNGDKLIKIAKDNNYNIRNIGDYSILYK